MIEENKKKCNFTQLDAEFHFDVKSSIQFVRVNELNGLYYGCFQTGELSSQARINCAKRMLQIRKESPKAIPVLTSRVNVNNLNEYFVHDRDEYNKPPKVVIAVEDYSEEYVDHSEKPNIILENIAQRLSNQSAYSDFNLTYEDRIMARIADNEELATVIRYLMDESLIKFSKGIGGSLSDQLYSADFKMTVLGWQSVRKRNEGALNNKVFIATSFKWIENENLRIKAVETIIEVCKELGYSADIVKQNHTENITDRIITEIKNSRFVIAELTYNNRGVYYESGFARGLEKPVFHLIRKGFVSGNDLDAKKIHFDIQQIMYREWETTEDLKITLKDWIEASIGRYSL